MPRMTPPPSKPERMELRKAIGNRVAPVPQVSPHHRGAECLWPHACFECQKSWKLAEGASAVCPECKADLHWMCRAFKVPRKADNEQWAKIRALWDAGYRFVNHTRWKETEPFPERLRDVAEFVRNNSDHPFRVRD